LGANEYSEWQVTHPQAAASFLCGRHPTRATRWVWGHGRRCWVL